MKTRILLLAMLICLLPLSCVRQKGYVQIGGYAQGGTWSVKYNTEGIKAYPAEVQRGVDAILKDIDFSLSGYNRGSELSRLNAGDTIKPSGMLIGLYDRCHRLWEETEGAVDVAAGPVFDIWGFGFKTDSLPSDDKIAAAMRLSGCGRLLPRMEDALLPDGRLCAAGLLRTPDGTIPQINFNAVAQGYSCDTVASYLNSLGIKDMLVDIGEIICRGVNQAGQPWKIGVDRPTDGNNTPGADLDGLWASSGGEEFQGIVTSGNYRKYYIRDGVKYSHTIDPRRGRPAENSLLSATVVAPCAEQADAIATYCMVIGLDAAQEYILSKPELEAYLIYRGEDGAMKEWRSEGFNLK